MDHLVYANSQLNGPAAAVMGPKPCITRACARETIPVAVRVRSAVQNENVRMKWRFGSSDKIRTARLQHRRGARGRERWKKNEIKKERVEMKPLQLVGGSLTRLTAPTLPSSFASRIHLN